MGIGFLLIASVVFGLIIFGISGFSQEAYAQTTITDFESFNVGANGFVMFHTPTFSGSTSGFLETSPNLSEISEEQAFSGTKSLKISWQFQSGETNPWLRHTTFNTSILPNPTIDFRFPVVIKMYVPSSTPDFYLSLGVRETGTTASIGENGGTNDSIEFVGATSKLGGSPIGTLITEKDRWMTVVFNPSSDPVMPLNGDGIVFSSTNKGTIENLAFTPISNTETGPYVIFIDDVQQLTPFLSVTCPSDGGILSSPFEAGGTHENVDSIEIFRDDISLGEANISENTWSISLELVEGSNEFSTIATNEELDIEVSCTFTVFIDEDEDDVSDDVDNCPGVFNPADIAVNSRIGLFGGDFEQLDEPDKDGIGNVCDPDDDNDGILDDVDNCQWVPNPQQKDEDEDGFGDNFDSGLGGCDQHDNRGVTDVTGKSHARAKITEYGRNLSYIFQTHAVSISEFRLQAIIDENSIFNTFEVPHGIAVIPHSRAELTPSNPFGPASQDFIIDITESADFQKPQKGSTVHMHGLHHLQNKPSMNPSDPGEFGPQSGLNVEEGAVVMREGLLSLVEEWGVPPEVASLPMLFPADARDPALDESVRSAGFKAHVCHRFCHSNESLQGQDIVNDDQVQQHPATLTIRLTGASGFLGSPQPLNPDRDSLVDFPITTAFCSDPSKCMTFLDANEIIDSDFTANHFINVCTKMKEEQGIHYCDLLLEASELDITGTSGLDPVASQALVAGLTEFVNYMIIVNGNEDPTDDAVAIKMGDYILSVQAVDEEDPITTMNIIGTDIVLTATDNTDAAGAVFGLDGPGTGIWDTLFCIDKTNTCTPDMPYSGPFPLAAAVVDDGVHFVRFHSEDLAGNVEEIQFDIIVVGNIDIKPAGCPNPINVKSRGLTSVGILGTVDFDPSLVDISTIQLAGVSPERHIFDDVATPFGQIPAISDDCTEEGPDGLTDLVLKFSTQDLVSNDLVSSSGDGDVILLELTGNLLDGTPLWGGDVIVLIKKG